MSYRERLIQEHAERLAEGVRDGAPGPVAQFAEYLAEQGALGHTVAEIAADMTVAQLVEAYVKNWAGQQELVAWARDVAEDEQVEAEINSAAWKAPRQ